MRNDNITLMSARMGWAVVLDDPSHRDRQMMSKDWEQFTDKAELVWTGNLDLATVALKNWQGRGQQVRLATIEVESWVRISTVGEGETANIT